MNVSAHFEIQKISAFGRSQMIRNKGGIFAKGGGGGIFPRNTTDLGYFTISHSLMEGQIIGTETIVGFNLILGIKKFKCI